MQNKCKAVNIDVEHAVMIRGKRKKNKKWKINMISELF